MRLSNITLTLVPTQDVLVNFTIVPSPGQTDCQGTAIIPQRLIDDLKASAARLADAIATAK